MLKGYVARIEIARKINAVFGLKFTYFLYGDTYHWEVERSHRTLFPFDFFGIPVTIRIMRNHG